MIHPHKYPLRQYLVDEPDPELRLNLCLIGYGNRPLSSPDFLNRQSIVLCLNRKGWTARVVHDDLVAALSEEAIAFCMVTKCLREAQISLRDPPPFSPATSPRINDSGGIMPRALEQVQFSSVRQFSHARYLLKTTVYSRFSGQIASAARYL
jgi:hypothetical protein